MNTPASELAVRLACAVTDDPRWRQAISDVPRHLFAPGQAWAMPTLGSDQEIDSAIDRSAWLAHVYEPDTAIIIQCDNGDAPAGQPGGVPTSSLSMPRIVAAFLELLDVSETSTVLEVGTGSGWTAGLLAHRLGDDRVATVEVDARLAAQAAANLRAAGRSPAVIAGDGADGHPACAPYDRIHVACGIARIPAAWISQSRPGAVIVLPWQPTGYHGHRLRLRVGVDGQATGRFHGDCTFMMMRAQHFPVATPHACQARQLAGRINPREIAGAEAGMQLMLAARLGSIRQASYSDSDGSFSLLLSENEPGGSWAAADHDPKSGGVTVTRYGERDLWAEAETAYAAWLHAGCPAQDRYGLTVGPQGQRLWLDHPGRVLASVG